MIYRQTFTHYKISLSVFCLQFSYLFEVLCIFLCIWLIIFKYLDLGKLMKHTGLQCVHSTHSLFVRFYTHNSLLTDSPSLPLVLSTHLLAPPAAPVNPGSLAPFWSRPSGERHAKKYRNIGTGHQMHVRWG